LGILLFFFGAILSPEIVAQIVLKDLSRIPVTEQPFQRYVYIPEEDDQKKIELSRVLNEVVSDVSNPVLVAPAFISDGVARIDLRLFNAKHPEKIAVNWERMTDSEPYFHSGFTEQFEEREIKIKVDPYKADDGNTYDFRIEKELVSIKVKGPGVHCPSVVQVSALTESDVPIVRFDWFINKVGSSTDGGLYQFFTGQVDSEGKFITQSALLKRFGVTQDTITRLRSDSRSTMLQSQITGKPRSVLVFPTLSNTPGVNQGLCLITEDISDSEIEAESDPIRAVDSFDFSATEIIIERPNGLFLYALGKKEEDGTIQLIAEAPANVAVDHNIPRPFTKRLELYSSCRTCHETTQEAGIKDVPNDLKDLLINRRGVNIFGDTNSVNQFDQVNRVSGLFGADLEKAFRRSREDLDDSVYKLKRMSVLAQEQEKKAPYQSTVDSGTSFKKILYDYRYELVTPETALREIGADSLSFDSAVPILNRDITGFIPEDPWVASLRAGRSIPRKRFEIIYADLAIRFRERKQPNEKFINLYGVTIDGPLIGSE
jgi:hypothetical protein